MLEGRLYCETISIKLYELHRSYIRGIRCCTMDPTSGYFHPFLGVEFSGEIKHENAAFHPLLRVKSGGFGASSASFNRESGAKCIYPYFC